MRATVLSFVAFYLMVRVAGAQPPGENRYDVLGKTLAPMVNVLLAGSNSDKRAAHLEFQITEVSGRLPKQFVGATISGMVQFPDKVKLVAPILGETAIVCRNGDQVWAAPGEKIEFLLSKFEIGPTPTRKNATPLFIPLTAQQAVFLPALFVLEEGGFETINGVECRVLTGGLMPELAEVMKSDDFRATMWVGPGYIPQKIEITRADFTMTVSVTKAEFSRELPPETWQPPEGATDIYRTSPEYLERVLYVVMNSLQMKPEDNPWESAR